MGATKKKRYEFYYRQEPSSGEEKRNVLEATRLDTGRDPCQGNPELDSSFSDNTADNDSVDTREFLEEVISDHAHLKDVIQEL